MAWQEFNSHEDFNRAKEEKAKKESRLIYTVLVIATFVGFIAGVFVGSAS